jgi:hypothetical protein
MRPKATVDALPAAGSCAQQTLSGVPSPPEDAPAPSPRYGDGLVTVGSRTGPEGNDVKSVFDVVMKLF